MLLNSVIDKLNPHQRALLAALVTEPLFRYLVEKYGVYTITSSLRDIIPLYLRLKGNEPYLERFGLKGRIYKIRLPQLYTETKEEAYIKLNDKDRILLDIVKKLLTYYEEKDLLQ